MGIDHGTVHTQLLDIGWPVLQQVFLVYRCGGCFHLYRNLLVDINLTHNALGFHKLLEVLFTGYGCTEGLVEARAGPHKLLFFQRRNDLGILPSKVSLFEVK